MVNNTQPDTYDQVPYPDLSYVQTHPDRLGMLGKLLGMNPAPVENCRVLEIGTAGGANLLAMAVLLPSSTFVGMDRSIVQIEQAQSAVDATGLTNIRFQQMDIMDITPEFGQFDYIIAHGIYSWVPPAVQEKLLDICNHNLAPQGIAYISYNTYPGWHRMNLIRQMMLYRTRNISDPVEKTAQAREWITFMAEALKENEGSAYAALFQSYLKMRATQSEEFDHAALLHDELETYNEPLYFYQFIERAGQHNLQYLAESDFATVMPNGLSEEVIDYLGSIAQTSIDTEQYMDFLRERSFRRTLLCHAEVNVNRQLSIQPVVNFYVSSLAHQIQVDAERAAKGIATFEGRNNGKFSTNHPLTVAAFQHLLDITPLRVHFRDLVKAAATRLNLTQVSDQDVTALAANLLRAFSYSDTLIDFHIFAPTMTTTVSDHPLTTDFTRFQTLRYSTVANILHGRVQLDNFNRLVLAQLDGKNDHTAILDFLVRLAEEDKIKLPTARQIPESPAEIRQIISDQLETTLQEFAEMALLIS